MPFRQIDKLRWATPCANPWSEVKGKRGAKAQGLAYQKAVSKALPFAQRDCWFYFHDSNGPGHCSPDLVVLAGPVVLVLECKLTDWPEAEFQITKLYKPVIEMALGKSVVGAVVARNLSHKSSRPRLATSLDEMLAKINSGITPTWHLPFPSRLPHISGDLQGELQAKLALMPALP